jgi:hypothetical protein
MLSDPVEKKLPFFFSYLRIKGPMTRPKPMKPPFIDHSVIT